MRTFNVGSRGAFVLVALLVAQVMVLLMGGAAVAQGPETGTQLATVTGEVTDIDGAPIADAEVELIGQVTLKAKTGRVGEFLFTGVPYGTYRVNVRAKNYGLASKGNVVIERDTNVAIQYGTGTVSKLKVIATVSTSANATFNITAASLAAVKPADAVFQGQTSWRQIIEQTPGVATGGFSYGGGQTSDTMPDAPFVPVVISINGALPYETATLFDGMPLQANTFSSLPGAGTDIGVYPMNAFTSADIVRGPGANSPSIINSIGGSFVLRPPSYVDKTAFDFSASNDPYGGIVSQARLQWRINQRLSAVFTYGTNDSPGPIHSATIPSFTTVFPFPGYSVNGKTYNCNGAYNFYCFKYGNVPGYAPCYCNYQNSLLMCCFQNSSAWSQVGGSGAISYEITPSITAQVFYAGQRNNMFQGDWMYNVDFQPPPGYKGSIGPGAHNFFGGVGKTAIQEVSNLVEEKITAHFGKSLLRIAALQNRTAQTQFIPPYQTGMYRLYGGAFPGGGYCDQYGQNCTQHIFNGQLEKVTFAPGGDYNESGWSANRDLLLSDETQIGKSLNAGVSFVSSYVNQPYWVNASAGAYQATASPANSETTNETRLHIGGELNDHLSADLSWYFMNAYYHVPNPADKNNTSTQTVSWLDSAVAYSAPRFGMVWRPTQDLAFRGAVGGGVAIAPLYYLIGSNGVPIPNQNGPGFTQTLVNLGLQPETAFGFDVGTDVRLGRSTTLSADLYRTNLWHQIFQSTNLTGTYQGQPLYTTQYVNVSQSRMEGINLNLSHAPPRGLYWSAALGLTRGYVVSVPPGFYDLPGQPNSVNTYIVPGINFNPQFGAYGSGASVPYANGFGQIGYRWKPLAFADVTATYFGNNNSYYRPAFMEFDAHAGYPVTKNVTLSATFRNITNIYPAAVQLLVPTVGAPAIANAAVPNNLLYPLYGENYGPRALIVTLGYHY